MNVFCTKATASPGPLALKMLGGSFYSTTDAFEAFLESNEQ